MQKKIGFTLIELMVTMVISAILFLITVPSIREWYKKNQFIKQSREIIDSLYDAQTAALANKKCSNGNDSTSWSWNWSENNGNKYVTVKCHYNSGELEEQKISLDDNIGFSNLQKIYYQTNNSPVWNDFLVNIPITISFSLGDSQPSIFIGNGNSLEDYGVKKIMLPFVFTEDENTKRTICFDRIANFPTISKANNCND